MPVANLTFYDRHPHNDDLYQDVIHGLSQSPRILAPKYFYDEPGSQLFDLITRTQDYYPTRTEVAILKSKQQDITEQLPADCILIEPGGGSCEKVQYFINELRPGMYVPIDISGEYLQASAQQLASTLPWLDVHAICDDFTRQLNLPEIIPADNRVVFFPGSSIGNFTPAEALVYLTRIATLVGSNGYLLIGVDLKKNASVLERAYADSEGVTARFNINLLSRINQELGADFDLQSWQHVARYNAGQGRIEMHLESQCQQVVTIRKQAFNFAEKETIHTENSYKYTVEEFVALAAQAGFMSQQVWQDEQHLFSVHLFQVGATLSQ